MTLWKLNHLILELATYDWLNHAQRLSNQAATHTAVQRQPEWIILWKQRWTWGVRGTERGGQERKQEEGGDDFSPVAASDKSWVLKPSWTCSRVSVAWASRLNLGPLRTERNEQTQIDTLNVCLGRIVILTVWKGQGTKVVTHFQLLHLLHKQLQTQTQHGSFSQRSVPRTPPGGSISWVLEPRGRSPPQQNCCTAQHGAGTRDLLRGCSHTFIEGQIKCILSWIWIKLNL